MLILKHYSKFFTQNESFISKNLQKGKPMQIVQFNSSEFSVRSIVINDEPWFVAKDVCEVLGLTHITNTLSRVDSEDLSVVKLHSGGQTRNMKVVNESGLYQIIFMSKKPQAKKFKRWVTSEVLPSIRKYGSYSLIQEEPEEPSDTIDLPKEKLLELLTSLSKGFEVLSIEVGNLNKKINTKLKRKEVKNNANNLLECQQTLKELDFVKKLEAVISNNPGINQSNLFKKVGKKRDDKTSRKILDKYTGLRWHFKINGREKQYFIGTPQI